MIDYPPTRSSVLQIVEESEMSDWTYQEPRQSLAGDHDEYHNPTWVYDFDVNLRIERGWVAVEDFYQEWIDNFSDTDATSYSFWIYYGRSPIWKTVLVSVDGHRAFLPIPDSSGESLTIDEFEAEVARIVTREYQDFQNSLEYADIEIE